MSNRKKLTEEQKAHYIEARRKTLLERYGDPNYNNFKQAMETKETKYGDSHYNNQEKHEQTCLAKYGVKHHNQCSDIATKISYTKSLPETQAKFEATMEERYGNKNPNLVPEIRAKYTETLLKNYGVTNPLKNKDIWQRHIDTMKQNGSFTKSQPEELFYKLLVEQYGEDDIKRHYTDERYYNKSNGKLFECDFYIKSEDKFIEINYHPSHYTHRFNPDNQEDIDLLNYLTDINTDWSNMIIDVWSKRDRLKFEIAEENNLNYQAIYPNK